MIEGGVGYEYVSYGTDLPIFVHRSKSYELGQLHNGPPGQSILTVSTCTSSLHPAPSFYSMAYSHFLQSIACP